MPLKQDARGRWVFRYYADGVRTVHNRSARTLQMAGRKVNRENACQARYRDRGRGTSSRAVRDRPRPETASPEAVFSGGPRPRPVRDRPRRRRPTLSAKRSAPRSRERVTG